MKWKRTTTFIFIMQILFINIFKKLTLTLDKCKFEKYCSKPTTFEKESLETIWKISSVKNLLSQHHKLILIFPNFFEYKLDKKYWLRTLEPSLRWINKNELHILPTVYGFRSFALIICFSNVLPVCGGTFAALPHNDKVIKFLNKPNSVSYFYIPLIHELCLPFSTSHYKLWKLFLHFINSVTCFHFSDSEKQVFMWWTNKIAQNSF